MNKKFLFGIFAGLLLFSTSYGQTEPMKTAVKADLKKKSRAAIKDLKIYIKPEDGKAYYTANEDKISGDVAL